MAYVLKNNLQFLAEASKILSSSLDYNVTLASVANLVVSNIADFCIIDLFRDNGLMERVAVRVSDKQKQKLANRMFEFPPDPRNMGAIYDAAKSARAILIKNATKNWLKNVSRLSGEKDIIRELKLNSHIFVPLISRGKVIGVLTFASNKPNFSYTNDDLMLAEEIAGRAGVAVDNARLFSEAQEAIRTRDELLSVTSHELKTPLTSILLNIQATLNKINKASTSEDFNLENITKMLETSKSQGKRLANMINDLLNVSILSTGRMKLEKENVYLFSLVKEILSRFELELGKKQIKISLKGDSTIVGKWDKVRLEQLITNLISNAIKYGEGKPISIFINQSDNAATIKVKDRGIGVKKEFQDEVFELFRRGVSNSYKGIGIGLYISRKIAESHGGKLWLESKENTGSTFIVNLPLKSK